MDFLRLITVFAPVVTALAWLGYLIFRKDLASKALGSVISYFLGVIIIFVAVGWLIDNFLISWVNLRLQNAESSVELEELNNTVDSIIDRTLNDDGTITTAPIAQPTPIITTPVPGTQVRPQDNPSDDGADDSAPTGNTTTRDGPLEYKVVAGDTLSGIAGRYGTTVTDLMVVNGLATTTIYVGQMLLIPASR